MFYWRNFSDLQFGVSFAVSHDPTFSLKTFAFSKYACHKQEGKDPALKLVISLWIELAVIITNNKHLFP